MELQTAIGYHCTSKEVWKKIKEGSLKGSKWTDDIKELESMNSNPFTKYTNGAVWCYPTLELARANQDDDEVILRIKGQGLYIKHEAHGLCFVGKANLCKAYLVRKNATK